MKSGINWADHCDAWAKPYFECLGEDFAHVLLAEVPGGAETILHFRLFAVPSGGTTSGARADGASKHFWSPPPIHGTFRVMETEDGVWVGESPSVRGLWEAGDYVQGREGEGGPWSGGFHGRRSSGVRGNDAGASGSGNGLHAATVSNAQDATGLVETGGVNERLRVSLLLVVGDGNHGFLGSVGRGRQDPMRLVGWFPIQRNGSG